MAGAGSLLSDGLRWGVRIACGEGTVYVDDCRDSVSELDASFNQRNKEEDYSRRSKYGVCEQGLNRRHTEEPFAQDTAHFRPELNAMRKGGDTVGFRWARGGQGRLNLQHVCILGRIYMAGPDSLLGGRKVGYIGSFDSRVYLDDGRDNVGNEMPDSSRGTKRRDACGQNRAHFLDRVGGHTDKRGLQLDVGASVPLGRKTCAKTRNPWSLSSRGLTPGTSDKRGLQLDVGAYVPSGRKTCPKTRRSCCTGLAWSLSVLPMG